MSDEKEATSWPGESAESKPADEEVSPPAVDVTFTQGETRADVPLRTLLIGTVPPAREATPEERAFAERHLPPQSVTVVHVGKRTTQAKVRARAASRSIAVWLGHRCCGLRLPFKFKLAEVDGVTVSRLEARGFGPTRHREAMMHGILRNETFHVVFHDGTGFKFDMKVVQYEDRTRKGPARIVFQGGSPLPSTIAIAEFQRSEPVQGAFARVEYAKADELRVAFYDALMRGFARGWAP